MIALRTYVLRKRKMQHVYLAHVHMFLLMASASDANYFNAMLLIEDKICTTTHESVCQTKRHLVRIEVARKTSSRHCCSRNTAKTTSRSRQLPQQLQLAIAVVVGCADLDCMQDAFEMQTAKTNAKYNCHKYK